MPVNERLRKELVQRRIPHEVLAHREAFTAQEVAQASHVPGRLVAKPVVIREDDGSYYMVVVTAPQRADLAAIHEHTGRTRGRLASESEIAALFPDCELGAIPPIGRLYDLAIYMDQEFRHHDDIYFQAGNHREVVKMKFADFEKLAGPFTGEFSAHREESKLWE